MDLKQLTMFVTVVEEGNISHAAAKLHMTQPPLSTQIKLLEEELGCQLFSRGSRSISLSVQGELLYQKALSLLTLASQVKLDIQSVSTQKSILRLGIISSLSHYVPQYILPKFMQDYPQTDFDLYEKNTYQMIDALFSHIISLAIIRTPFQNDGLQCYPVKTEAMYAVGQKKYFHSILPKESISLNDLLDRPLIVYRRWKDLLDKQFHLKQRTPHYFCVNDDARTTLSWAKEGYGIAIVPASIVTKTQSNLIALPFDESLPGSSIFIVHLRNHALSEIEQAFINYFP